MGNYKALGKFISDYRKQVYKSQRELADDIRMLPAMLNSVEKGVTKLSIKNMRNIAEALSDEENSAGDIMDGMVSAFKEQTTEEVKEEPIAIIVCKRGLI